MPQPGLEQLPRRPAGCTALCSCPTALPGWGRGLTSQHQKASLAELAELAGKPQVALNTPLGEISVGVLVASFRREPRAEAVSKP